MTKRRHSGWRMSPVRSVNNECYGHQDLNHYQFSSVAQLCPIICDPMDCNMPGLPVYHHLPWVNSNSCPLSRWCHPTISSSVIPFSLLPSIFPSLRDLSNESAFHIRWTKYLSFSFSISPSNEYSELISSGMDWLDLLAVQGTLKNLSQHHSSKASILRHSAFFIVQFSHPYMTTEKTIALTRWTFVGKAMSLLFNILSKLVIDFLPRSKCPNFIAAVTICNDFGTPKNKVCHCSHCFPTYLP